MRIGGLGGGGTRLYMKPLLPKQLSFLSQWIYSRGKRWYEHCRRGSQKHRHKYSEVILLPSATGLRRPHWWKIISLWWRTCIHTRPKWLSKLRKEFLILTYLLRAGTVLCEFIFKSSQQANEVGTIISVFQTRNRKCNRRVIDPLLAHGPDAYQPAQSYSESRVERMHDGELGSPHLKCWDCNSHFCCLNI